MSDSVPKRRNTTEDDCGYFDTYEDRQAWEHEFGELAVPQPRRLIIAAYWTEEVEPFMEWGNGKPRWPTPIKGSGAKVSMTPEQADQPGLRDTLRRLQLEEAADYPVPVIDQSDAR